MKRVYGVSVGKCVGVWGVGERRCGERHGGCGEK